MGEEAGAETPAAQVLGNDEVVRVQVAGGVVRVLRAAEVGTGEGRVGQGEEVAADAPRVLQDEASAGRMAGP